MPVDDPHVLTAALASGGDWHMRTDVVVVGAGLAGYCAALEAASRGVSVLLLEKQAVAGGTSGISGGAIAFAGTDEQQAQGINDSPERLFADLQRVGGDAADRSLLAAYAELQHETYGWLKTQGLHFISVQLGSGQSVPRSNRVDAGQMMQALAAAAAQSRKISVLTSCAAQCLVRAAADGRVTGLVTRHQGKPLALHARLGVILTSGGFSRSESLLRIYAPALALAQRAGSDGSTGDGLVMARALGADTKDMDRINSTFGRHPGAGPGENALLHPIYKGAIAVNRDGRRFTDESRSYKVLGEACLQQPEALAFQIFDRAIMDLSVAEAATSDFKGALQAGLVLQADDLSALARRIGCDEQTLGTTVSEYNADVPRGIDSRHGRASLANGNGQLRAIATPPFYAYPCTSAILATYCGLAVDAQARVIDGNGKPIPGLYAAGEITGGFHGNGYMTGSSLGKAAIFGRAAGRAAALFSPTVALQEPI